MIVCSFGVFHIIAADSNHLYSNDVCSLFNDIKVLHIDKLSDIPSLSTLYGPFRPDSRCRRAHLINGNLKYNFKPFREPKVFNRYHSTYCMIRDYGIIDYIMCY